MAEEAFLLRDLAIVMIAAAATGLLFRRLKQPAILGYLVAGVLVGPHLAPFPIIRDTENITILAQLGTLFLLFSMGLNFHLGKLRRVGAVAVIAGALEISLMIGAGVVAAGFFGWRLMDSLFLGAILAISGAAIILKVLEDMGRAHAPTTEVVYGIVLVERVAAVILMALLSSLALSGTFQPAELLNVGASIVLFILVALVLGLLVVPRLVDRLARTRHGTSEHLVVVVLAVAFGTAVVADALGLSLALGAFIAGAIIAESRASELVIRRVAPLRDAFIAVFFVAMGLLVNPADVQTHWLAILTLSAVVVFGKIAAVGLSTFIAGYPSRQAFDAGISMACIGGFALVIANLGQDLGVTEPFLFPVVASVTAVTAFTTPLLMRHADTLIAGGANLVPDPVRTFSRTYTTWLSRQSRPGTTGILAAIPVQAFSRVVAYGALLATLVIALGATQELVMAGALDDATVVEGFLIAGAWAVFALLAVPVTWGLVRAVRRLVGDAVDSVLPQQVRGTDQGAAVAAVLRNTMHVFAAILGAAVIFAAGAIFLPTMPLLAGALVVVAGVAYVLRTSLRTLNREVEEAMDTILEGAHEHDRERALETLRERYAGALNVEDVLVPATSAMVNHSIREMALTHRTGATVVTHERDGRRTVNPPPDLVLRAGDMIGIMGTPEETDASRRFVLTETPTPPPAGGVHGEVEIAEIRITHRSPVAGTPLAESRIREETGATVMALHRGDMRMPSPALSTLLQPEDVLVLLGSPKQVEAARRLLAPGE